jgi:RNA polymerase sigma-70 factor (ECF subfamily)
MTARACIDHLRSARRRRETYVGPWLPEPVRREDAGSSDPSEGLERAESISMAFLVLLQTLSPLERAAFILHDVFDYDYAEIGGILGRGEAACRQLVSRARGHLRSRRPRFDAPGAATQHLTERFLRAARGGDLDGLVRLLSRDVTLWVDGGGKVAAATRPVEGAANVARYWVGLFRKVRSLDAEVEEVNGVPAIILSYEGHVDSVISLALTAGRIVGVYNQRNPEKLARLRAGWASIGR